jgi:hypothetical protein
MTGGPQQGIYCACHYIQFVLIVDEFLQACLDNLKSVVGKAKVTVYCGPGPQYVC